MARRAKTIAHGERQGVGRATSGSTLGSRTSHCSATHAREKEIGMQVTPGTRIAARRFGEACLSERRATMRSSADLDTTMVEKAYARWAPIYDTVCGPIFEQARRAAARAACAVGGRILEVGVGTGLSFDDYDASTEIVGIDLSAPMIAKARERLASGAFPHVREVLVMDAHHLRFPDTSFDCVVAQFVITLVAQPERVLDECARVVRPGGEIILVNHLYSERGVAAAVERWFARPAGALGLRPEFPFARLAAWAHQHGGIEIVERRAIASFGNHTLVRFRRQAGAIAVVMTRAATA
jgi:phosphatidylethanolamine/phosphatidyl-N-methylethanolamine N-methyltransferase